MAILDLDTGALVKLYVRETGTDELLRLAHPDAGNRLAVLSLSRIEFRAALRRRAKLGDIDGPVADELLKSFSDHISSVFQIQPANEAVVEKAAGLVDRYVLRAYDSLQLAGCSVLKATVGDTIDVRFVCADATLLAAARAEGFATIDPISIY